MVNVKIGSETTHWPHYPSTSPVSALCGKYANIFYLLQLVNVTNKKEQRDTVQVCPGLRSDRGVISRVQEPSQSRIVATTYAIRLENIQSLT